MKLDRVRRGMLLDPVQGIWYISVIVAEVYVKH